MISDKVNKLREDIDLVLTMQYRKEHACIMIGYYFDFIWYSIVAVFPDGEYELTYNRQYYEHWLTNGSVIEQCSIPWLGYDLTLDRFDKVLRYGDHKGKPILNLETLKPIKSNSPFLLTKEIK